MRSVLIDPPCTCVHAIFSHAANRWQGFQLFTPSGAVWGHCVTAADIRDCFQSGMLVAPWGEDMTVNEGDYIVMPIGLGKPEVYRVQKNAFSNTYKLAPPGTYNAADFLEEHSPQSSSGTRSNWVKAAGLAASQLPDAEPQQKFGSTGRVISKEMLVQHKKDLKKAKDRSTLQRCVKLVPAEDGRYECKRLISGRANLQRLPIFSFKRRATSSARQSKDHCSHRASEGGSEPCGEHDEESDFGLPIAVIAYLRFHVHSTRCPAPTCPPGGAKCYCARRLYALGSYC